MYTEDEKDKEDESSIGAWYSYYKGIESHVQLYEKDLLVYRIDYNEYTGGAHGIYMTTYLNMDLTLMRPLRLDDIFVGDYKEPLTDLIWNQLMADNKVTTHEALEDMGYASTGDITPDREFLSQQRGRHVLLQCIRHHSILHGPRQSDNSIPNVGTSVRQQPDFGRVERLKPYFH